MLSGGLWLNMLVVAALLEPRLVSWVRRLASGAADKGDDNKLKINKTNETISDRNGRINKAFVISETDPSGTNRKYSAHIVILGDGEQSIIARKRRKHSTVSNDVNLNLDDDVKSGFSSKFSNVCISTFKAYGHLLKTRELWLFFLFRTLANVSYGCATIYLPAYAAEMGLDSWSLSTILALMGVSELICRIILGCIGDFNCVSKIFVLAVTLFICGVTTFPLLFMKTTYSVYILTALLGLFGGTFRVYNGPILVEMIGFKQLGSAMALTFSLSLLSLAAAQVPFGKSF